MIIGNSGYPFHAAPPGDSVGSIEAVMVLVKQAIPGLDT